MTRRTKLILLVMALVSVLGLTVATNAWFVSVSATPPGKISSALVHYLPDSGSQTITSILGYGNLISGSGADTDGVALVLPGDRLLPLVTTAEGGAQTVRTSIARPFEAGETVDTVIHWKIGLGGETELTYKQRDLMLAVPPKDQWYINDVALADGETTPSPAPADYIAVTTTTEATSEITVEGHPASQTTTTVTTTYTPRKEGEDTYQLKTTTTKTVIREKATITPVGNDDAWAAATKTHTATETVLFAGTAEGLPTRSLLLISPVGVKLEGTAIPLTLENRSTVATNVRIGLNATVTTPGATPDTQPTTVVLTAKTKAGGDGTYYLGAMAENHFIELLAFRPTASWKPVTGEPSSNWALWDLTTDGTNATIPSIPSPTPGNPDATADPTTSPGPTAPPTPVRYPVTEEFGIVSPSSGVLEDIDPAVFERLFNQLYCDNAPVITIHLRYYVRQSEFMDWTEFYSTELSMSMPK